MECEESDMVWHDEINMDGYTDENVCNVLVNTDGGDCYTWCEYQGLECYHA